MLGLTFASKLDWGSYIISIVKTLSKKIGAMIHSMKFLSPEVLCISINAPMQGILLSHLAYVPIWDCQTSYKNEYARLLLQGWLWTFMQDWSLSKVSCAQPYFTQFLDDYRVILCCQCILKQIKLPFLENLLKSLWQTLFWAPEF